ncbi:VOC family protein [Streptomyces sp. S07_1.15]|uniref:VOC family protein n=1 Tax=Streptomyces sp. S07_1.15 TaxID=2873925 RepID=UPI001D14D6EB|nr:VOC family protein [Streptomyces sp. S07_1.15]MCC3655295.1 VOC family protein [Streptomyces sp. S07_1.15]
MTTFAPHHIALSVGDLDRSKAFYGYFGFRPVAEWSKSDKSLTISHLRQDDGFVLELFHYADDGARPRPAFTVGNNLPEIGVKHVGFTVPDLAATRAEIIEAGIGEVTEIARGRTLVDYFFVIDPDGMYVEVVNDARDLDPERPLLLGDAPR